MLIVVDLDGTLCDISKRREYVTQSPKDWKMFFKKMVDDIPNQWCLEIVNRFVKDHQILLVTGRPREYEKATREWLATWNIQFDQLFMREEGDFRVDHIIKQEIYDRHIRERGRVLFVLDDRQQVVDMWRRNGVVCLQCDDGNF